MIIYEQIRLEIGRRLSAERERLGLSKQELADATGIGRNTILKYENGLTSPTADHLNVLDQLGADIYFIATGKQKTLSPDQQVDFLKLTDAVQEAVKVMGFNPSVSGLLAATWIVFNAQTSGSAIDAANAFPKALASLHKAEKERVQFLVI